MSILIWVLDLLAKFDTIRRFQNPWYHGLYYFVTEANGLWQETWTSHQECWLLHHVVMYRIMLIARTERQHGSKSEPSATTTHWSWPRRSAAEGHEPRGYIGGCNMHTGVMVSTNLICLWRGKFWNSWRTSHLLWFELYANICVLFWYSTKSAPYLSWRC